MSAPIEVLVWNEFRHETRGDETVLRHYPDGIHRVIADGLAESLGDRTVSVAYWLPDRERFVDEHGRPVELPAPGSGRAWTAVERDGKRVLGALAIGGPKMKLHKACVRRLFESNEEILDIDRVYEIAKEALG